MAITAEEGWGVRLSFEDDSEARAFDALLWPYFDQKYLRFLGGSVIGPSAFLSWWILLQGFSQLARYAPAAWTRAISPTKSRSAVPIEQTLEIAAAVVPGLVFEALAD